MLHHIREVTRRVWSELERLPGVDARLEQDGRSCRAMLGDVEAQLISWDHWDAHHRGSSEWWAFVANDEALVEGDFINHTYWHSAEEFEALANLFVTRVRSLLDVDRGQPAG